jgi:hypothetical protein
MSLKEQREDIERNFKHFIKLLENGSDDKVYGLIIPMFEDIMKSQLYTERNVLIKAIKEFYSEFIIIPKVISENQFIELFIGLIKGGDTIKILKAEIMAFLFGFLETSLFSRDKEKVVKHDMELKRKRNKNKKKREQKKRNKWKKPPSPSLDYKTYDWNIPSSSPPQYVF